MDEIEELIISFMMQFTVPVMAKYVSAREIRIVQLEFTRKPWLMDMLQKIRPPGVIYS